MQEINPDLFKQVPLRVHSFLAGIPMRTLYRMELPGGYQGLTMREISAITGFGGEGEVTVGPITTALFWLRGLIGRIMHWEDAEELAKSITYLSRLTEQDRRRSLMTPGNRLGISRVLYCFEQELLAEIVNRTVHCFWLMASERTAHGYALYVAIYVKKLNWFTPIYMALITPVVKWIVYPSIVKGVRQRWDWTFPPGQGGQGRPGNISHQASPKEHLSRHTNAF